MAAEAKGKVPKLFSDKAKEAGERAKASLAILEAHEKARSAVRKAEVGKRVSMLQHAGGQADMAMQARMDAAQAQREANAEMPVGPPVEPQPYPDAAAPSNSLQGVVNPVAAVVGDPATVSGGGGVQAATGGMGRANPPAVPPTVTTQSTIDRTIPLEQPGGFYHMAPQRTVQTTTEPNVLSPYEAAQLVINQQQEERLAQANAIQQQIAQARLALSERNTLTAEKNAELRAVANAISAGRLSVSQEQVRLALKREGRLKDKDADNLILSHQKGYQAAVKHLNERQDYVQAARDVLATARSGNQVSPEILKIQLPRVAGEVGALSDQDREATGGGRSIVRRMTQYYQRAVDGTLTEENAKDMEQIINLFEKSIVKGKQERAKTFVGHLRRAKGGAIVEDDATAWSLIDSNLPNPTQVAEPKAAASAPSQGPPPGAVRKQVNSETGEVRYFDASGKVIK